MISISLSFPSIVLLQPVRIEIGLPHSFCSAAPPWKTLWGLHCAMEQGDWFFRSLNVGDMIDKDGFAFVAPSLGNGWFINSPSQALADFLEELFESLPSILPLSTSREDNAIVGVSMGGFGALRSALRGGRFARVSAISTVFDPNIPPDAAIKKDRGQCAVHQALRKNTRHFLLDDNGLPRPEADLLPILKDRRGSFPLVDLFCGEQDYIALPQNLALEKLFAECGLPSSLFLSPGGHDISYWRDIFKMAVAKIFGESVCAAKKSDA